MHNIAASFSDSLFQVCLDHMPSSPHQTTYSAIICGASFPSSLEKDLLQRTSLLHLLVVSGSHLLFLESLLRRLTGRPLIITLGLVFYLFLTNLQAPVLRAALTILLQVFNQRWRLCWTGTTTTLLAGGLCLCIFPQWIDSLSLILSWAASLAIAFARESKELQHPFLKNALIFSLLFPLLIGLSPPHPSSILFNALIGPLFGALLFPLGLLSTLFPPLVPLTDFSIEIFYTLLGYFASALPPQKLHSPLFSIPIQWVYLGVLQLCAHLYWVTKKRQKWFQ